MENLSEHLELGQLEIELEKHLVEDLEKLRHVIRQMIKGLVIKEDGDDKYEFDRAAAVFMLEFIRAWQFSWDQAIEKSTSIDGGGFYMGKLMDNCAQVVKVLRTEFIFVPNDETEH